MIYILLQVDSMVDFYYITPYISELKLSKYISKWTLPVSEKLKTK